MIENLSQLVQYHDHQVASRSLSRLLGLSQSIVLYAMAQGESISQETSPKDKVILVLEGQLIFDLEDQKTGPNSRKSHSHTCPKSPSFRS